MELTRAERIRSQADAFLLFGLVVLTNDDRRQELNAYREKVRDAAPARVKIALACANNGLKASAAMKLLNQTIEERA